MPFPIIKADLKYSAIVIHECVDNTFCNSNKCKRIKKFEKIRYLSIIFDITLKWNFHINNLLSKLRFITYKFA